MTQQRERLSGSSIVRERTLKFFGVLVVWLKKPSTKKMLQKLAKSEGKDRHDLISDFLGHVYGDFLEDISKNKETYQTIKVYKTGSIGYSFKSGELFFDASITQVVK